MWNRWDLHVHTPASIVHDYPGDADPAWSTFLDDLENLPPQFKVIGINDYLFLEGYRRVLAERMSGRLQNLAMILPVIELRLPIFGGSGSKLSKVNYHVVFSDELEPDVIETHFVNALMRSFRLLPRFADTDVAAHWTGIVSQGSLESLGSAIIATAPEGRRPSSSNPRFVGFSNLTVELPDVERVLESSFLQERFITAIGKTEWHDIRWQEGSIADKRNVINGANCVLSAAQSPADLRRSRTTLFAAGVNHHLLDCSDAHALSTSAEKDRIGNCWTWIKADLTFAGLLQALEEYDDRVYLGDEPDQLRQLHDHPSRFIDRIEILKNSSSLRENWFDGTNLPLNSGLVAIIGNRGNGKSALAETIALAAGTTESEHFSFLHKSRFRDPRGNLASHFVTKLRWHDADESPAVPLDQNPATHEQPRVRHLPQKYLETLCNEMPRGEKTEFDRVLEEIIFSHLPAEDRLGASSLDFLLSMISSSVRTEIEGRRRDLSKLNQQIWHVEQDLTTTARMKILNAYRTQRREWRNLKHAVIEPVPEPQDDDEERAQVRTKLRQLNSARQHLLLLQSEKEQRLAAVRRDKADVSALRSRLAEFQREFDGVAFEVRRILASLEITDSAVELTINFEILDRAAKFLARQESDIAPQLVLGHDRSIPSALESLEFEIVRLQDQLTAPQEAYELYLRRKDDRDRRLREMVGTRDTPGSLKGLRAELASLDSLPGVHRDLIRQRDSLVVAIHELLVNEASQHADLYRPLQEYMERQQVPVDYMLGVSTTLVEEGLIERLLETMLNRQVAGSFMGIIEGRRELDGLIAAVDFNDSASVLAFAKGIEDRLHRDYRNLSQSESDIERQLRGNYEPTDVYDLLYGLSFLSPRFGLTFGNKPIYQLSPGEKGTLLLIFFLLADREATPLIVDQPEDNLDNQTVYTALVGAFRAAKKRRQVIVVTHNPNVAVVCDADQVIVAQMNKEADNRITYTPGAIENPIVLRAVIDILEGTPPAFKNRSLKYNIHQYGRQNLGWVNTVKERGPRKPEPSSGAPWSPGSS